MRDDRAPHALDTRGVHPDGRTICIEVRVCLGDDGRLWSSHSPATPEDEKLLRERGEDGELVWQGGGHRHIAHALLMEAVRREAFVCLLIALSQNPEMTPEMIQADEKLKARLTAEIAQHVGKSLATNLGPMVLPSVQEALDML